MDVQEFKKSLRDQGLRGLALDIDDTLASTDNHWWDYMFDFHTPEDVSREEITSKYKFAEEVPAWQTEEGAAHIQNAIHSEEFNESIPLIEDADKAVWEINKIFPVVAYITARPSEVLEATKRWLNKHNFPDAELITRAEEVSLGDLNKAKNRWKANILKDLYPEIVGIVDDNPTLVEELRELAYEGKVLLYGSKIDLVNDDHVSVCPTWADVLKEVKKLRIT